MTFNLTIQPMASKRHRRESRCPACTHASRLQTNAAGIGPDITSPPAEGNLNLTFLLLQFVKATQSTWLVCWL